MKRFAGADDMELAVDLEDDGLALEFKFLGGLLSVEMTGIWVWGGIFPSGNSGNCC